ncbi:hypothetical protein G6F68_021360 [Rhizopus microsporus]|nr:hypothetical protein G6F68_021360 [Rhizopus microsporus]
MRIHRLVQHIKIGAFEADDDRERALAVLVREDADADFAGLLRQGRDQRGQARLRLLGMPVQNAPQRGLIVLPIHLHPPYCPAAS